MSFGYNPFTDNLDYKNIGTGNGDVTGPGSSTANDIAIFADTTGKTLADSGVGFPIPVSSGGTSRTTLTNHGLLLGAGTSGVNATAAGSAGQVLQSGGASADPAYSTTTYPSTAVQGDIIYASATNTISSLAKDTSSTRYLSNTGVSNAPAWAQVGLTTGVSGTLPVTNGGTNQTTLTNHGVLLGAATSGINATAAGTAGQVLQSGGASADPTYSTTTYPATTTQGDIVYASAANTLTTLAKNTSSTRFLSNTGSSNNPAWAQVGLTTGVSGTLPIANGGTNQTSFATSNGLVKFDGTSLAGSGAAILDASNRLTNTSQPVFYAYLNTGLTNVTGDSTTINPLIFDTTLVNVGTSYSTSTGIFTAPVTGKYLFNVQVTFSGLTLAHTSGFVSLSDTFNLSSFFNPGVVRAVASAGIIGDTFTVTAAKLVSMSATQTFKVQVNVGGSTKVVGIQGNSSGIYTSLSGVLLC